MKNIEKRTWMKTLVASILIFTCVMFIRKIYTADTTEKVLKCICDSSFAAGFMLLCVGLLVWCSNQGAFIGLSYGFKQIFEKRRFEKTFSEREKYGDYRERKLKKQANFLHLIIVGAGYLVISIIILLFI